MNRHVELLVRTPSGREVLTLIRDALRQRHRLDVYLRAAHESEINATLELLGSTPLTTLVDLDEALGAQIAPSIVVVQNATEGRLKVLTDKRLGPVDVQLLHVDDPDSGSYSARGLPHPSVEAEHLEFEGGYTVHNLD